MHEDSRCLLKSLVLNAYLLLYWLLATPLVDLYGDALPVWRDLGLCVVEEGVSNGVWSELSVIAHEVNARRHWPLGALVEEDLGESVGHEALGEIVVTLRILSREDEDSGRGLDPPSADAEWLTVADGGGRGKAAVLERGEELLRDVCLDQELTHCEQDPRPIVAEPVVGLREVEGCGEVVGVGEGLLWEEHDVGHLRGQADLADTKDNLMEPGGRLRILGLRMVREKLELHWDDAEPALEELELQRGQGPAAKRAR